MIRGFNLSQLGMEQTEGSLLNQIIGVGTREGEGEKGPELLPVHETYPSHYRHVLRAFEYYPIVKYFGLTPSDAMNLPLDQWYELRKVSYRLAKEYIQAKQNDTTANMLVELLKELLYRREVS